MSLFDDASLVLTPNGYKASKLYSIKPTSGLGDMTVVRATTATRVNSAGLIESVAINVPRLDYPPLGGCPNILVEPLRTNLVLRSEEFDNAYWNKSNITVTPNTAISPDGTTTADNVNITATNGFLRRSSLTFANSTSYTISIFVKKSATTGTKNFRFYYNNNASAPINSSFTCLVDLTNITATTTASGTIPPTILSTRLVNYGNNWYRVEVAFTTSSGGGNSISEIGLQPPSGGPIVDFDAWGAQLEAAANATSYIPTTTATVTRNADVISKTGISSLIGQTEGTLYAEINITTFNNGVFFTINDGTSANRIQMYKFTDNKIYCDRISATQSVVTSLSSSALSVGTYKVAFAYQSGNSYLYINGTQVGATSAATFTFGSMGKVNIGSRFDDTSTFNDRIELATLFPTRLTNAQLATLTTL